MSNITVRSFPFLDTFPLRPLDSSNVNLSGEDLEVAEKIEMVVENFSKKIGLNEVTIVVSNSPDWCSFFNYFLIPLKCFTTETQRKIHNAKILYPMNTDLKKLIDSKVSKEREVFISLTEDQNKWIIAHEIGHMYLSSNFKMLNSDCIEVNDRKIAELRHDRAQERVCDFIATNLTSAESGIEALQKESEIKPDIDTSEDTHPPFADRIQYISDWKDDPRISQNITEDLLLDVGGECFREAVDIYQTYGR